MRNKKNATARRTPKYGRESERVFSYYSASRKQLNSFERNVSSKNDRTKSDWLRIRSNRLIKIIATVTIVIGISYLSYLNSDPIIKINGTQYRSPSVYKNLSKQVLLEDIRNKTKLFLQTSKLSQDINQSITESSSVSVSSSLLGHSPVITITTSKPLAIFQQKGAPSFIINTSGKLIINLSDASRYYSSLPTIQNNTGLNNRVGDQVLSPDQAFALKQLLLQYSSENKYPKLLMPNVAHELDVQEVGKGYFVKYVLDTTINSQFGAMRAAEKKLFEINQMPSSYIDVRLSDKAYVL
jgi:hypothetical protein